MIRQTENPSELTVQNLLLWLQGKYDQQSGARKGKKNPECEETTKVGILFSDVNYIFINYF